MCIRDRLPLEDTDPPGPRKVEIKWRKGPKAPTAFDFNSCAVKGNIVYYYCAAMNNVFEFDVDKEEWSVLSPVCPQRFFTLVIIEGMLCVVGGEDSEGAQHTTDEDHPDKRSPIRGLMSGPEGKFKQWVEYFPRVRTLRCYVAATYMQEALIIAGGTIRLPQGEDVSNSQSVEVLYINNKQWYTACDLPYPIQRPSIVSCSNKIFINGAYDKQVYMTSLTEILLNATRQSDSNKTPDEDHSERSIWKPLTFCPTSNIYLDKLDGKLITVGGLISEDKCSKDVYTYDIDSNEWNVIGEVSVPQRFSRVSVLPEDKVILAVGWTLNHFDDTVEIGTIER